MDASGSVFGSCCYSLDPVNYGWGAGQAFSGFYIFMLDNLPQVLVQWRGMCTRIAFRPLSNGTLCGAAAMVHSSSYNGSCYGNYARPLPPHNPACFHCSLGFCVNAALVVYCCSGSSLFFFVLCDITFALTEAAVVLLQQCRGHPTCLTLWPISQSSLGAIKSGRWFKWEHLRNNHS